MIPIPATTKQKLIDWIPKELAGTEHDFIETQRNIPRPEVPAIIVYFSTVGPLINGNYTLQKTVRNANFELDDYWGQTHLAVLNVSLRSYSDTELAAMHEDFIRQIFRNRRELKIWLDDVRFLDILRSESLPIDFERESASGQRVFMATLDLKFEYRMVEVSDADVILKATNILRIPLPGTQGIGEETAKEMILVSETKIMELTCALVALVEDNT